MKVAVILFLAVWLTVINTATADSDLPDIVAAASSHHSFHSDVGGGKKGSGKKYGDYKSLTKSGKKSERYKEKGQKGSSLKELHKTIDDEEGGKKAKHHSAKSHKSYHSSGSESLHGAKFHEGSRKKKANYKKGFRDVYHKDEEKKHNSFYSDAEKSGEYVIYGKKNAKHASEVQAKQRQDNHKGSKSKTSHAKGSKKGGGHNSSNKKGYQGEKGSKSHHSHHDTWADKGSKKGGKQYKYKVPSHK